MRCTIAVNIFDPQEGFDSTGAPNRVTGHFEFTVEGSAEERHDQIKDQLGKLGYHEIETAAYLAGLVDGRLQAEAEAET